MSVFKCKKNIFLFLEEKSPVSPPQTIKKAVEPQGGARQHPDVTSF
jgi:hypothetical protein